MNRILRIFFVFFTLIFNSAQAQNISIGTGGTGGVYFPMGQGLASVLSSRVPGMSATAEVTGGSIDNLNLIATGRPYIGFSMADAANDAQMGVERFLGKKVDLKTLLVLYPNRMHIVTIEGSGIRTLQDLKGRRVSTGAPGSATEVMAVRLLEAAGINIDNDLRKSRLSVMESANAVKDRQLDAFFWLGGLPTAAITDLANSSRNKLVMIDHSHLVDSMNRKYGNLYFKDVIPRTTYAGMDKDNQNISIANLLVAGSRMSDKDAYDIVKTLFDNKLSLVRTHFEFFNVTLDGQRPNHTPVPYHPGVIKYFQEKNIAWANTSASTASSQIISPSGHQTSSQNQPPVKPSQSNQPPPVINQGRRVALVIGNASYSSVPQLTNPTNDAREVTRALQATGFEVIRLENADLRQMQDAVRSFGNKLGKNDVGLFYFSGHGVQVKGKNFLIPVKENIKQSFEVPSSAIDADLVLATMENAKNNLNIMILDACRSPFPGEARSLSRGLATLDAAKGTLIAYATAPGKEALDGQGSNSPYTKHLVRALQQKGLPIEQVFKQVRIAVVEETKGNQVPWENSSIMGDFYFRK